MQHYLLQYAKEDPERFGIRAKDCQKGFTDTGKYWTGIGSRRTPPGICKTLRRIAILLREAGYTLRSGHADKADQACELGAGGQAYIYLPWAGFNGNVTVKGKSIVLDSEGYRSRISNLLSILERCLRNELDAQHAHSIISGRRPIQLLHARNVWQVLGHLSTQQPSDFLVCYAKPCPNSKQVLGGTNSAVQVAHCHKIPVHNLYTDEGWDNLSQYLNKLTGFSL